MIGQIIKLEAVLLVLPLAVSIIYRERCALSFLITALASLFVGFAVTLISKPGNRLIYAKEGFGIVALAWLALSALGAVPFVLSGEVRSYADAFFETVSGFTTTGASVLTDIEGMSHGLLFWRSFTHWVGGMGVLVFIMAIIPSVCDRSIHILRAEMPGPVMGKLVPKLKQTAKILYLIYIVMTVLEMILLLCGGMSLFDSALHSFATAGTGGFGIKGDSIASYSPYLQWVIAAFMFLFGINFNIYYLLLVRRFRSVLKSTETWCYIAICLISVSIITGNIYSIYGNLPDSVRASAFQVASLVTTTGFSTADFNLWPGLSKGILLILMFIGGCAGSTAGGLKVSRVVMMIKMIRREFMKMIHPRSVSAVRIEGKKVDDTTLNGVNVYFALYMVIYFAVFLLLCLEPFDFETNFTAVAACYNNIGPGFGAVGPMGSFSGYSAFSKIVLSATMLLGRLEIYPLLFALIPSTWTKKG